MFDLILFFILYFNANDSYIGSINYKNIHNRNSGYHHIQIKNNFDFMLYYDYEKEKIIYESYENFRK